MRHFMLYTRWVTATLCACSTGVAAQEATFTPLGFLLGADAYSWAKAVSDDGRVIAGDVGVADPLDIIPFIWTEATGMIEIKGRPPGVLHTLVHAISADGSFVAGRFWLDEGRDQAFLWERDVGYILLPSLPGEGLWSVAAGIARDGARIFGNSGTATAREAVVWDHPFDAPQGLGGLPGGPFWSVLGAPTPDGLSAVGRSFSSRGGEAVLWREDEGFIALGDLPGGRFESAASGLSADGRVVVGLGNTTGGKAGAFRWTEASGMVPLGLLPGDSASAAGATTGDGSVVVGNSNWTSSGSLIETAFIWDRIHGMRNLKTVLETKHDLDLTDWHLHRATDITPDGRFIVGQATNPAGVREAYRVQIPPFCYADCDDSSGRGVLDFLDFLEFQRRFALQDAYSDCDENGVHDFFDFLCFQNHFAAGCD